MPNIARNQPEIQRPITPTGDSRLNRLTEHNIHLYSVQSNEAINRHIEEMDKEWSVERVVEASLSILAIIGIALGAFVDPWCLVVPAIVSLLSLAHATTGFSPALTVLRGKGMRTDREIDVETFAMNALKSDAGASDTDKAALADRIIATTRAY